MNNGILVLEDGATFEGTLFGAPVDHSKDAGYGEVVFNTSMTGYQEILTDPSYYGQMICMTVPHIGNTGVNSQDVESEFPRCAGFITSELSQVVSNWRSEGDLNQYLEANKIPGIKDIDTRALTRHLRSIGVLRGLILGKNEKDKAKSLFDQLPAFEGRDLISEVTAKKSYILSAKNRKYRVVAMDFGVKKHMLQILNELGCDIEVVSAKATSKEILDKKPDGIFLSNGPGDPAAAPYAVDTVKKLLESKLPIFGVCMGHQILSLALGAKTYKLKFGHRGGNQPVLDKITGKVEISAHNHGYAVDAASLGSRAEVTHLNLNDQTVEGIRVKDGNAFSVQYHPEACPGPHDSEALFKTFIGMMSS
jgi:carbamoyl-phosphate synthase small subunit